MACTNSVRHIIRDNTRAPDHAIACVALGFCNCYTLSNYAATSRQYICTQIRHVLAFETDMCPFHPAPHLFGTSRYNTNKNSGRNPLEDHQCLPLLNLLSIENNDLLCIGSRTNGIIDLISCTSGNVRMVVGRL